MTEISSRMLVRMIWGLIKITEELNGRTCKQTMRNSSGPVSDLRVVYLDPMGKYKMSGFEPGTATQ